MDPIQQSHVEAADYENGLLIKAIAHIPKDVLAKIVDSCPDAECSECGVLICPNHDPLHFHHDGCPSCYSEKQ